MVWSETVVHELAEIHDYLAAVASPENALWTIERILSRAEQIAVFPQIGREVEDSLESFDPRGDRGIVAYRLRDRPC